jgi:fatty acid desaturase
MNAYRDHHWNHHRYTNTELDPDWNRKILAPQWQFPKTRIRFFRDLLPYCWGLGIAEMLFAVKILGRSASVWPRVAHALVFISLLIGTLGPIRAAAYWLAPYFLVLPLLMKVRSVVEHLGLPNKNALNGTRNIVASPVERFFFGPHWNNLHLVHHLFPNVPWHNVPKLQTELMQDQSYALQAYQNASYFLPSAHPVVNDLIRASVQAAGDSEKNAA